MSYLATLARPAEPPTGPAVEPSPVPVAETFREVHEEVVAAPRDAAPEASEAPVVGSEDRAPRVAHDLEVLVKASPTPVEPTSRQAASREALPMVEVGPAPSTPVVAQQRVVPDSAQALESTMDATSVRGAPSPLVRRTGQASPAMHVESELLAAEPSTPAGPRLRPLEHGRLRDEPARERIQPLPHAPMTPSVRSAERADRPAVHGAPAPTVRPEVTVHIGAISLTVKAPAAAAPAARAARAAALPTAQPMPVAVPPRSREGLGFSASRHYLRWS